MDPIEQAIHDAWSRLGPLLHTDSRELARRLARGRAAAKHPPRAWCLAIRASDTRLDPPVPPHRLRPHLEREYRRHLDDFATTLTAADLRRLCAPVTLEPPGEPSDRVAAKLGASPHGLRDARLAGVFQVHHVTGLLGRPGKPQPLLYAQGPLDPTARSFRPPDPVWSWTAQYLTSRLPENFPEQTLYRFPHFQATTTRRGDDHDGDADRASLHPEHPLNDPPPPRESRRASLPPPRPDYVGYKWDRDEYLGHDRRNPLAKAAHFKAERRRALANTARRKRYRENPPPSSAGGSIAFRGWRWICPRCQREVNVLFLPLPPVTLLPIAHCQLPNERQRQQHDSSIGQWAIGNRQSHPSFACEKCVGLRRFSRCDPNAWNEIIRYLSGGLLYGHEVPRPSWFPHVKASNRYTADAAAVDDPPSPSLRASVPSCPRAFRKLPYTPRPNREPSQRRPQIEQLLLCGHSLRRISKMLRTPQGDPLAYGTVLWHAQQIYKQHGVRSLSELLIKHGKAPRVSKKEQVRQRLFAGQSATAIAGEMGISREAVYNHVYMLRKATKLAQSLCRK